MAQCFKKDPLERKSVKELLQHRLILENIIQQENVCLDDDSRSMGMKDDKDDIEFNGVQKHKVYQDKKSSDKKKKISTWFCKFSIR